jgi:hypothetical protein
MNSYDLLRRFDEITHSASVVLNKYNKKEEEVKAYCLESTTENQYASGGLSLHRGYYCLNPIKDLVVGKVDRGRLLPQSQSRRKVGYAFFFNSRGEMVGYEKKRLTDEQLIMFYIIKENECEWEFSYDLNGHIDELYLSVYSGGNILIDVFLPCISGQLFEASLAEAWSFNYCGASLYSAESVNRYINPASNSIPMMLQSFINNPNYPPRIKYIFKYDNEGKIVQYECLEYKDQEFRSLGLYNCKKYNHSISVM